MVLSGLKGTFFLIVLAATILTLFSFFTPGWRFYDHDYNEGLWMNHRGEPHSFEGWVIAFFILTFILQLLILILTIASFTRKSLQANSRLGMLSIAFSSLASLFLLVAIIWYSAWFDEYYDRVVNTLIGVPPVITRGYSFWFTVADLIFMLVATIVGIVAFFQRE